MEFENYENYIDIKKVIEIVPKTKKYVARLELAFPLITSFNDTHVEGREFKGINYEGKEFDYRQDVIDVIELNKEKILKNKAHATITFLELGKFSVVIGIEINESFKRIEIARFIGNFFSRPLFHGKKWFLLTNTHSHLFNIKELNEYNG